MSGDLTQNHSWTQTDLRAGLGVLWEEFTRGRHLGVKYWNFPFCFARDLSKLI